MGDLSVWVEELHPRNARGEFGPGGAEHASAFVRVIPASEIEKSYAGVSGKLIKEVHEFSGSTGLKAVIVKRNGDPVYQYTDQHNQAQSDKKFARATELAKALGPMRERIATDLKSSNARTRDLATVTSLIDQHCIRVGGSDDEKRTGSVGASTIQADHVFHSQDGTTRLMFPGKSGVRWNVRLTDPAVISNVKAAAAGKGSGEKLFRVSPQAVNDYIRDKAGLQISAKDFRTFHATSIVQQELSRSPKPKTEADVKRNISSAIEKAASTLGHTPTICRSTYVNPAVIDMYELKHAERVK